MFTSFLDFDYNAGVIENQYKKLVNRKKLVNIKNTIDK
nr:MAG TPA: hypothetical protein [Caudoviricetes sp.]